MSQRIRYRIFYSSSRGEEYFDVLVGPDCSFISLKELEKNASMLFGPNVKIVEQEKYNDSVYEN